MSKMSDLDIQRRNERREAGYVECEQCRREIKEGEILWPGSSAWEYLCQGCWEAYADRGWWKAIKEIHAPRHGNPRWVEIVGWTATCVAVTGVLLNNRQSAWCFAFWLVSNALTAIIHLRSRLWALTARDVIFLALAVQGWWCWTH